MTLSIGKSDRISRLTTEFGDLRFQYFTSTDNSYINCVVCWLKNSAELAEFWGAVQNILSLSSKSESRASRWNLYLVFICEEKIESDLKQQVQNDKYCARKVILDSCGATTDEHALRVLNDELFGIDLVVNKSKHPPENPHTSFIIRSISKPDMTDKNYRIKLIDRLIKEIEANENQ